VEASVRETLELEVWSESSVEFRDEAEDKVEDAWRIVAMSGAL